MRTILKLLASGALGGSQKLPLAANLRQAATLAYFSLPNNSAFDFVSGTADGSFSLTAWIQPIAFPFNAICRGNGSNTTVTFQFSATATGVVRLRIFDDATNVWISSESNAAISLNTLTHIAASYDGSESQNGIKVFVNGVEVAQTKSVNGSYANMTNHGVINFGRFNQASPSYSSGYLVQAGIFKGVAFTEAQAAEAYNNGTRKDLRKHSQSAFLSAFYDFQDLTDSSGNGHTLTDVNTPLIQKRYIESSFKVVDDGAANANTGGSKDLTRSQLLITKWGGAGGVNKILYWDKATNTQTSESASFTSEVSSAQANVYIPDFDAVLVFGSSLKLFQRDGTYIRTYTLPVGMLGDGGATFENGYLYYIDASSANNIIKCTIDETTITQVGTITAGGTDTSGLIVEPEEAAIWRWVGVNIRRFSTAGTLLGEITSTVAVASSTEALVMFPDGRIYANIDSNFHASVVNGNIAGQYEPQTF